MKLKKITTAIFTILCVFIVGTSSVHASKLDYVFDKPSIDAYPGLYWYWMNGNVTKEGIIEDLKAMNEIGVGWVYIMDIGLHPTGKVLNRSAEWYDMVRTAIKEAKKYGIMTHVASPGWATSGGPWITPEQSIKELVWTETVVEGGVEVTTKLQQPSTSLGFYKDIAVLAFPSRKGDALLSVIPLVKDINGNTIHTTEALFDNSYDTKASLPNKFELQFPSEQNISSVFLRAARANGYFEATIEGWDTALNMFVNLGMMKGNNAGPFSPQVGDVSFSTFKTDRLRIVMSSSEAIIEELSISGGVRMPNWIGKAGFGTQDITEKSTLNISYPPVTSEDVVYSNQIINITKFMKADGTLNWTAPKGDWTVQRFGYTTTGISIHPAPAGGAGLEVDKMSKSAVDFHYNKAIKELLNEVGEDLAPHVTFHHVDSYESGWQNWTADFSDEFYSRCKYDIIQCLPAMTGRVLESIELTEKFYWDLRGVISDVIKVNHYSQMSENGKKDGLRFSNEPYGGPFNFLEVGGVADVPMVEFWIPSTQPRERKINFEGVFAGRTNGRKIIASETFTSESPSERWSHHPYNLKATGDFIFCSGVNRFIMR